MEILNTTIHYQMLLSYKTHFNYLMFPNSEMLMKMSLIFNKFKEMSHLFKFFKKLTLDCKFLILFG